MKMIMWILGALTLAVFAAQAQTYDNPTTGEMNCRLPNPLGATFNPTIQQYQAAGYRLRVSTDSPTEGFRVVRYAPQEIDARTCKLIVAEQKNIAEEEAEQAAAAAIAKSNRVNNVDVPLKDFLEIVVRIHNLKVPAQYKVTADEAKQIVHDVIYQ